MQLKNEYDVYLAASLFNRREVENNLKITKFLEDGFGRSVFIPQRDGFEFTSLVQACSASLPEDRLGLTVAQLIYYLDMGYAIPHVKDDGVVAVNLDEPVDGGVLKEASHAGELGKEVVGFRSDTRGFSLVPECGGAHYFNTRDCDVLVRLQPTDDIETVARAIEHFIENGSSKRVDTPLSPKTQRVLEIGEALYRGNPDIHTPEGLQEILSRRQTISDLLEEAETQYVSPGNFTW